MCCNRYVHRASIQAAVEPGNNVCTLSSLNIPKQAKFQYEGLEVDLEK